MASVSSGLLSTTLYSTRPDICNSSYAFEGFGHSRLSSRMPAAPDPLATCQEYYCYCYAHSRCHAAAAGVSGPVELYIRGILPSSARVHCFRLPLRILHVLHGQSELLPG